MSDEKIPIWLDCDPGIDDAFAIVLASSHPNFKLLGISTVHGNTTLLNVTRNACSLIDFLKIQNIKIYKGSNHPVSNDCFNAHDIHGNSGLGNYVFTKELSVVPSDDMDYLEAMKNAVISHENKICIVCIGPLTNMYHFAKKYPDLIDKIHVLSIMGGALGQGNVTKHAEFNFYVDPEASMYVIENLDCRILLSPLDFTNTVPVDNFFLSFIQDKKIKDTGLRKMFYELISYYTETQSLENNGMCILHDPVSLFSLIPYNFSLNNPDSEVGYKFKYTQRDLNVIPKGEERGKSFVVNSNNKKKKKISIMVNIDSSYFWDNMKLAFSLSESRINRT